LDYTKVPFPLTLTLSLGERESPLLAFGVSDIYSTNPASGFQMRQDTILLLRGEKAGMRAVVAITSSVLQSSNDRPGALFREGDWIRFSLSPRERAGVRGKGVDLTVMD